MECQRRICRLRQRWQADLLRHPLRELDFQDQPLIAEKNNLAIGPNCHPDNYDGVTNILYHNNW